MMDLGKFEALRTRLQQRQKELERKRGEIAVLERTLREEFGCNGVPEAEERLKAMASELRGLKAGLEEKMQRLEEAWGAYAGGEA